MSESVDRVSSEKRVSLLSLHDEEVIEKCVQTPHESLKQSFFIISMAYRLTFSWQSRYHIKTSTLISCENQCTGFYVIGASVMKELNL